VNAAISSTNGGGANNSGQQAGDRQHHNAQQVISENIKFLIEQLEQGKSETLTAYLAAMAHFHNYSFGNILSIARNRPDATHVAGIRTWNELGRFVIKGQKGIPILAPLIGHKRQLVEQVKDSDEKQKPYVLGFRRVFVFDISQTEGADLPEPARVSGEVGLHRARLFEFVEQQGIVLEFNERIAPAQGASYGGKIVLLPGQSGAEEFATLAHEVAHEMLHRAERRTMTTKTVRETEAEAIAFIVSRAVGLNTGSASADYISLYHGNTEMLTESLNVIQQASSTILEALFIEEQEDALAKAS
jgi:hypothetical protein